MISRRTTYLLTILAILILPAISLAQSAQTTAQADEQVRMQPLIDAEIKASEALNKKVEALPEIKAYKDAQEALKRAGEALRAAAAKLPENSVLRAAAEKTKLEAYRIQAAHGLSSLEYEPRLDKGKLVFIPKPVKSPETK